MRLRHPCAASYKDCLVTFECDCPWVVDAYPWVFPNMHLSAPQLSRVALAAIQARILATATPKATFGALAADDIASRPRTALTPPYQHDNREQQCWSSCSRTASHCALLSFIAVPSARSRYLPAVRCLPLPARLAGSGLDSNKKIFSCWEPT